VNGDIEIEIGAGPEAGHYAVRVLRAAAGGEPVGTLELDVDEISSRRELLENTVLASAVARRSMPVAEQPVREVGLQLFRALFTGPVYGMYRASLGVAQERGKRLRVVLRLTAPELAALPWEMLFDPETGNYLSRQEPLVRHVHAPYTTEPLAVRPPLRVLGLVASPRGLPRLDVDAETSHLAEALAGPIAAGLIELVWAPEATWPGIHAQLLAGPWHVLHFVGHGDYDTRTDEGVLALVGADGRADLVEADRLADLLGEAQPTPRLVVLNSCSSGRSGMNDLFSGTAAVLARSGISAVAAMQFAISDTAAIAFARGFYTAIAHGRSIDEAARSGRISILGTPRSLEWVTPVLYVRGQPGRLFTLTTPGTGREAGQQQIPGEQLPLAPQFTEPDRRRSAELRALYVEARAELRLEHYDTAIGLFDDLLTLDPGYVDAIELRDEAQRSRQLADAYASAVAAENAGDWTAAARGYGEILGADPAYKDAADRKDVCERRQRVADLDAELRHHASVGQWQAVLDVDSELGRLDPSASDPDGLTSHARTILAHAQRAADPAAAARSSWTAAADRARQELTTHPAEPLRRINSAWAVNAVCWHPDGRRVACAAGIYARVYDVSEKEPAEQLAVKAAIGVLNPRVNSVAFSPDGARLATGSSTSQARVWDAASGQQLLEVRHGMLNVISSVAFSPDGTRLATGGYDKCARVWDAASGRQLLEIRHDDNVTSVAFSPDGTRLATGSSDKTVRIWRVTES
jgi:tetratricopeptide (TPR) repeat protein